MYISFAGRMWFRNLKKHHANLRIPGKTGAMESRCMEVSEKDWVADRNYFMRSHSGGDQDFPSTRHIFMIEVGSIHNLLHPEITFDVLVSSLPNIRTDNSNLRWRQKKPHLLGTLLYGNKKIIAEGEKKNIIFCFYDICFMFTGCLQCRSRCPHAISSV